MHRYTMTMACSVAILHGGITASADEHHDLYDITDWLHLTNQSVSEVTDLINSGFSNSGFRGRQYRIPIRLGCTFVRNTGNYQTGFWWFPGWTEADLTQHLNSNNGRLIDIEPFYYIE